MKLMFMELFKVDSSKYGDRLDHISSIGKAKKRVAALASLKEKPFVLVLLPLLFHLTVSMLLLRFFATVH